MQAEVLAPLAGPGYAALAKMAGFGPGELMDSVIWAGAGVTILGFAGIIWTIMSVVRARRAGLDDATLRLRLNRILPVNLAALLLSVVGLMIVVVGVVLG